MIRHVVFILLMAYSAAPVAHAASAASAECDRLASHPDDPWRRAEGVVFEKINADRAIEACKQALDIEPNDVVTRFQMGRAFEAAGSFYDAGYAYHLASDEQHILAPANLLNLLWLNEVEENREFNITVSGTLAQAESISSLHPQAAHAVFMMAFFDKQRATGLKFLEIAVKLEYPDALADYGRLLFNGNEGIAQNRILAMAYFNRSASLGSPLGKRYQLQSASQMLGDAFSGVGGGGGSPNDYNSYRRGYSGPNYSSDSGSYTPPIGGDRGLYGSSHGVGD